MRIPRKIDIVAPGGGGGGGGGVQNHRLEFRPEYAGASLTMSGSNNSGGTKGMTCDVAQVGNTYRNYYEWISDVTSQLQSYDVHLQIPIPSNFTGFQTGIDEALQIEFCTQEVATTNNKLDITIQKNGVAATTVQSNLTSNSAGVWRTIGIDESNAILSSLAAEDILNIRFRFYSFNDKYVRLAKVFLSVKLQS